MSTGARVLHVARAFQVALRESFADARFRHEATRIGVRQLAQDRLNDTLREDGLKPLLRLTGLDALALGAWRTTWSGGRWDWRDVATRMQRRPARVEVAIWHDEVLCGMAWGRLSERREVVGIDLVERNPGADNPLKGWIALIAAETATITADVFGATRVRFRAPIAGAIQVYEALGFAYVKARTPYCEKVLP